MTSRPLLSAFAVYGRVRPPGRQHLTIEIAANWIATNATTAVTTRQWGRTSDPSWRVTERKRATPHHSYRKAINGLPTALATRSSGESSGEKMAEHHSRPSPSAEPWQSFAVDGQGRQIECETYRCAPVLFLFRIFLAGKWSDLLRNWCRATTSPASPLDSPSVSRSQRCLRRLRLTFSLSHSVLHLSFSLSLSLSLSLPLSHFHSATPTPSDLWPHLRRRLSCVHHPHDPRLYEATRKRK